MPNSELLAKIDLKPMDIIVTREPNPISWYIRMKTNSDFSHVCLAGKYNTIFTTTAWGYDIKPADKYLRTKSFAIYRWKTGLTEAQIITALDKNYKVLDTPYSFWDLFNMISYNFRGRGLKKLANNSKNYFCAEIVSETYRDIGLPLMEHLQIEPSGFTPQLCIMDHNLELIYSTDVGAPKSGY